jgi:sugar phosphate permease
MSSSQVLTTARGGGMRAFAVLIMLFLFQTLNFFDKLVFGLSAVPMMKELSLTPRDFGLIGSSFFLLFSLSGMAVGLFVIGRFPAKWILTLLAAVWSATQIPIFFSSSVVLLVICRIIRRRRGAWAADRAACLLQLVSRRQAQRAERGGAAGDQR